VRHLVAFNPYDYPQGVGRANRVASLSIGSPRLPAIGPVVTRMENKPVLGIVLRGALVDDSKLPDHSRKATSPTCSREPHLLTAEHINSRRLAAAAPLLRPLP
jgi:hypothetical protein